jgi:hypothetical protein
MTDKVLLASNTLVTSVTFFACSQVVFAFSLSLGQKATPNGTKKPNQSNTTTSKHNITAQNSTK